MKAKGFSSSLLVALVLVFTAAGRSDPFGADRLIGSWKSNRELTISNLQLRKKVSTEAREDLEKQFGTLTLTFKGKELEGFVPASGNKPEWHYSSPYAIVAATDNKVMIRHIAPATKRMDTITVIFDGPNRCWVSLGDVGGKECFDRIVPVEQKQNIARLAPSQATVDAP
jgi:hypothetical protein